MADRIDLRKHADALGYWSFQQLEKRLTEKHSRTASVKARIRPTKTRMQFSYEELYPCDAQWAGIYDRMHTHEDDETARRFQIAADFGERADG